MNNARYFSTLGAPHLWENSTIHNGSSLDSCWPQKPTLQKLPDFFLSKITDSKPSRLDWKCFLMALRKVWLTQFFFSKKLEVYGMELYWCSCFFWPMRNYVKINDMSVLARLAGRMCCRFPLESHFFTHVFRRAPMSLYMLTGAWKIQDDIFVIIWSKGWLNEVIWAMKKHAGCLG